MEASPTTAAEGDTITVTATPAEGCKLKSITVNGKEIARFLSGIGNMDGRLVIMLNLEEIVGLPKEDK